MADQCYLAADLGASNGRTILGRFDGSRITLEEINRFDNGYIRLGDAYYWDILALYANVRDGLARCASQGVALRGVGIDTWGVDFGLIDKKGNLIGAPRAYRDPRGARGMKAFTEKYGPRTAFDITGIANMAFNTLFQLYDMKQSGDPQLGIADKLLLLPDLLGYMLCGGVSSEYTHATTTQLLGISGDWSDALLGMIGVPKSLMAPVQKSATMKGRLLQTVAEETGLCAAAPVYCVGAHDTASAVASVPASGERYAFLSSGTWSLMGIVSDTPILSDFAYGQQFSNEGTVDGKYRLLRNIMGLWIIQNCKKQWDKDGRLHWDEISAQADQAPAFASLIDVNDDVFFDGGDMPGRIRRYCENTAQPVPQSLGEIARTVYESLALSYRDALEGLEALKRETVDALHIVGGGSKNKMLNQYAANATRRRVVAGPAEATATGNLMMQVLAGGAVANMREARQVIRDSFPVESYEPRNTDAWDEPYERLKMIKNAYAEGHK